MDKPDIARLRRLAIAYGGSTEKMAIYCDELLALLDLADRATAAEAELEAMREVIRKCRDQFEFYVSSHMAKSPPDMDKAATNQEFVEMLDRLLDNP